MIYLWEHSDWPEFIYNQASMPLTSLYQYSQSVGRLVLELEKTPEDLRLDAVIDLMVKEAITTSAIEGEKLNPQDVRSSLKNHLGLSHPPVTIRDPRARGISALVVTNYYNHHQDLSEETLFQWHRMILPRAYDTWGQALRVGQWHVGGIAVVSGPLHKQKIHFEAPPAEKVAREMKVFIEWFNRTNPLNNIEPKAFIPGPIRAATAHLWFVIIHPFDDGNGHMARAIADYALSQDIRYPMVHSLSAAIERHRDAYYQQLEEVQQQSMDVTQWVQWFIQMTAESVEITEKIIAFTVQKSNFIKQHRTSLNKRQL